MGNALGERVRSGERAAFAEMYERFADRIYGFCVLLLRDRDEAGDVTHDTFVVAAQRIAQLRDAERLQSWLFAIARHQCYRRLRQRGRVTLVESAPDDIATDDTALAELSAAEASALVWNAAEGLNERDRAVLYLNTSEGLEGAELAAALGERQANPYSLLNRAKQQLERAVTVLLVARFGRRDCPSLAAMLQAWDGSLTPLLRKRLARHVEQCASCQRTRTRALRVAAFSATPLMRPQRVEAMPAGSSPGELLDIAARRPVAGERWRPDGFPPSAPQARRRRRRVAVLLAAALVLLGASATYEVTGGTDPTPAKPATFATPSTRAPARPGAIAASSTTIAGVSVTLPVAPAPRAHRTPVTRAVTTTVPASTPTIAPTTLPRRTTTTTTVPHVAPTTDPPPTTTPITFNF